MFRRRGQPPATSEPPVEPAAAPPPDATATAVAEAAAAAQAAASGDYGDAVTHAAKAWTAAAPVVESFKAAGTSPAEGVAAETAAEPAAAGLSDEQVSSIADSVAAQPPPAPATLTQEQLDGLVDAVAARVNAAFAAQPPPPPAPPGISDEQVGALADAVAARLTVDAGLAGGRTVAAHSSAKQAAESMAAAVQSVADDAARQALVNAEMEADRRARSNVPWFKGIALGLGAGALAVYFLSPYSGEELRSLIQARLGGYKSWEPPLPSAGPDAGFTRWESGLRSHPPSSAEIRATAQDWAAADQVDAIEVPSPDAGMPIPGDIPGAADTHDIDSDDNESPAVSAPKP